MKFKTVGLVLMLCVTLALSACVSSPLAMLETIVAAAEAIIPAIPGLSPDDAAATTSYINSALSITNDILDNGANAAGVAKAVNDFDSLVVPKLGSSNGISILASVTKAVASFLTTYRGATATVVSAPTYTGVGFAYSFAEPVRAKKIPPMSAKEKAKAAAIQARIKAAQAKLKKK